MLCAGSLTADDRVAATRRGGRRWRSRASCTQRRGWAFGLCVADRRAAAAAAHQAALDRRREPPRDRRLRPGRSTTSPTSTRSPSRTSSTTTAGSPRFLAKAELFDVPVVGAHRAERRPDPGLPADHATRRGRSTPPSRRCERGECVVVYPEGTITRQPDLWPMTGKTGAARIALDDRRAGDPGRASGARSDILAPYAKRPQLFPRKTITMKAGDPVDLDDLRGQPLDARGAARGDRPDHGRDHRAARGASAASRRRPSGSTRARPACAQIGNPHEQEPPDEETPHDARSRCSAPARGARRSPWCSPTPATTSRCGPGARSSCATINEKRENTDYLPGIELPDAITRHPRPGAGAATAPSSSCSPCRRRRCAPTSPSGPTSSRATRCWSR